MSCSRTGPMYASFWIRELPFTLVSAVVGVGAVFWWHWHQAERSAISSQKHPRFRIVGVR